MEKFLAPDGKYINIPVTRIMTFGLTETQSKIVRANLPSKSCELYIASVISDLAAISSSAVIINADALNNEDLNFLVGYYTDVIDCLYETVCWFGYPSLPRKLQRKFKCYQSFEELSQDIKYILLTAHGKEKKAKDFSKKLADCLMVLSLIRTYPGISTKEISLRVELPVRTVQRYITTLQVTGEWIEYDYAKRGWRLQNGISILFGDHMKDTYTE